MTKEQQRLFEQYSTFSDDRLRAIINDDSYEDYAKQVAISVLNSDRTEYLNKLNAQQKQDQQRKEATIIKNTAQQTDPLYDDIHNIARNVRIIKNVLLASAIALGVFMTVAAIDYLVLLLS